MRKPYKIFLDTEFKCGFRRSFFWQKKRQYIDLISIGLVDELGRTFYRVCKDFDLDAAWKDNFVREHVLRKLHSELAAKVDTYGKTYCSDLFAPFTKKSLSRLLSWYGKTRKEIAGDILWFVYGQAIYDGEGLDGLDADVNWWLKENQLEFWAYYADYDWVLFCSLFGELSDKPEGFPYFCNDLMQIMHSNKLDENWLAANCPEPDNEHHALADALWNKDLYEALHSLPLIQSPVV